MSESIVILSFYQFSEVALTQKLLDGLSHLSFALDGQVKCRPKKQAIIKVSHRVVAEGTVCVCVGGGGGGGGGEQRPSGMTGISAISLISIILLFLIKPSRI